jgi:hypothetical protein
MSASASVRFCAETACEIGLLNVTRGELELSNAQERIWTRQYEMAFLANAVREADLTVDFASSQPLYEKLYADEYRTLRRSTRSAIRALETEAEQRREAILKELEAANARYRMAREAADASRQVLQNPIPEIAKGRESEVRKISQKTIDGLRAAIENLKSKRPNWEKIAQELSDVQQRANRSSPKRSPTIGTPHFGFTLTEIERQAREEVRIRKPASRR